MVKHKKFFRQLLITSCLAISLFSIPISSYMQTEIVAEAAVKLNATSKVLSVGDSIKLMIKGSTQNVKWKSKNNYIATVNQQGKVFAKKPGVTNIIAELNSGTKRTCKIKVYNKTKQIKILGEKNYVLEIGDTIQLHTEVTPNKNTRPIVWNTSDDNIVSVSSDGFIYAIGKGHAAISASSGDKSITVHIIVQKNNTKQESEINENYDLKYHKVIFNTTNGLSSIQQIVEHGRTAMKPENPKREGYSFAGWYTDDIFSKPYDFTTIITDDINLYAKWNNQYKVSFISNGGGALETQMIESGDKVIQPSDPTKYGMLFDGWYTDSTLKNKYDFNTSVDSDITLYARWKSDYKNTATTPTVQYINSGYSSSDYPTLYTVTFECYNDSGEIKVPSQIVKKGDCIKQPENLKKSGYEFLGWYKDLYGDEKYDFSSSVNNNIVLYAGWRKETNLPSNPDSPNPPGTPDNPGTTIPVKNPDDVAAVTKIIQEQKALGALISEDLDNDQYAWTFYQDSDTGHKEYRLTRINWHDHLLQGNISFSELPELYDIDISNNRITGIDISSNVKLSWLRCEYNDIDQLDMKSNPLLYSIRCNNNKIKELDLSSNFKLKDLYCNNNLIEILDVSKNILLTNLSCNDNKIAMLDISNCDKMEYLWCGNNNLRELNLKDNIRLTTLSCINNNITNLDLTNNAVLSTLLCDSSVNVIGRNPNVQP